jgi:hypothetical protein
MPSSAGRLRKISQALASGTVTDPGGNAKGPRGTAGGAAYRYLGVGLTWALSTILGVLLGAWADGRWGTSPALTLLGMIIGTVGGFAYMYHQTVVIPRDRDRSRRERESK